MLAGGLGGVEAEASEVWLLVFVGPKGTSLPALPPCAYASSPAIALRLPVGVGCRCSSGGTLPSLVVLAVGADVEGVGVG